MRTRLPQETQQFKGPQPRKPLHPDSMTSNTSPHRMYLRSQDQKIGFKSASNEELNVSGNKIGFEKYNEELDMSGNKIGFEKYNEVDVEDETDFISDKSYGYIPECRRLSLDSSPKSRHVSSKSQSPQNLRQSIVIPKKVKTHQKEQSFIDGPVNVWGLCVLLVTALSYVVYNFGLQSAVLPPLTKEELTKEIKNIKDEFPSQHKEIWVEFSAGIKKVDENPSHPSVFLLLHDDEEETPACLARMIAKLATRFLNATNPNPLVLDGEELSKNKKFLKDYGELIIDKQHQVEERRSMIVNNLHKIPAQLARSLHTFCDIETPLVDKAVYLFTLNASGASRAKDRPTALAEKVLKNLWGNQLSVDILQPLIVRITDTVVVVKPEKTLTSSCQM